ncbi:neuronal acetylcholine receptor subunit beta-3-like [Sitophilus oryzae]|uniref:Neuronal acetylcholine receptor subunit beta-3-like n=1 Tax=Sitophilus oryzae TaxID=7048 RepID=A0A6J2Y081_SITOR|nr:neuronal acetylcholine receptor subunit beta-3-like [Sitophilus oryzae]
MKCILLVLITINFQSLCKAVYYQSNSTDLTKCSTISYSRTGSNYKEFYPISVKNNPENGSLIFDFHFAVLATSDAHILLAPSDNITKQDPVYELVIGAGGNTFSDIRRMQKSDVKASVRIKNLLSALDPHFFWIHMTKIGTEGLLEVGREGDNTSFISWQDPDPLPIKVISFSTWSGIEAKWYFDCDRSGNEEEIQKSLTPLEKLRRIMLAQYDPMVRPVLDQGTFTMLPIWLNLKYLELDEHKSTLYLMGTATLKWRDEKLDWDPKLYGDIQTMHIFKNEIWQPKLLCSSAVSNPYAIFEDSMMVVNHTGMVTWRPAFHLETFCNAVNLGDWPRDTHTCNVSFEIFHDQNVLVIFDENGSSLLDHEPSQWLVLEAKALNKQNTTLDSWRFFNIIFKVKRSSSIYTAVFFSPFLVIAVLLLTSFWVSTKGHMKISMGCAQLLLETLMLLTLGSFVPNSSDHVPNLTLLYSWSLVGTLVSIIISIIVINFSREKQGTPLSHILCNILTIKFVKRILFLPDIIMPDEYGHLGRNSLTKNEDKGQSFWFLLGVAIDRISFFVYLLLVCYVVGQYIAFCL